MIRFDKEIVLSLYKKIVEATGGSFGIRSESLLESAINAPYQTYDNLDLFPSVIEKGARLGYGLVANHPFIDGNKRIGVYIMLIFFEVNSIDLDFTNEEVVNIGLGLASGEIKYEDLLTIINNKYE